MLNLGFFELTLFGIIALIVLGPEKLLTTARTLGKWYANIRQMSARLKSEFVSELQLLEVTDELKGELAKMREAEAKMKAHMTELERRIQQNKSMLISNENQAATDEQETITHATNNDLDNHHGQHITLEAALNIPMTDRWFLLSNHDKKRRLPNAPFLPNHQADPLLSTPLTPLNQPIIKTP
ncbi:preprotein translocase subunit TatA [Moraxella sp. Tifton1]|uniref:preprotein translocase subunit TatA n=1 Tax=Moraxella oculi TaxID=2940516 RepID=UPI002012EAD9|nr:preprotein translocase subunit TatA [Moraxella sp. Tifton1]